MDSTRGSDQGPVPGQTISIVPKEFVLCNKARLAQLAHETLGRRRWNVPESFVMPKNAMEQQQTILLIAKRLVRNLARPQVSSRERFLVKPAVSSYTKGIIGPTHDPALLLRTAVGCAPSVIQRVVENVALVDGHKSDLRVAVLCARGTFWVHREWVLRVAAAPYQSTCEDAMSSSSTTSADAFFTVCEDAQARFGEGLHKSDSVAADSLDGSTDAHVGTVTVFGAAVTKHVCLPCAQRRRAALPGGMKSVELVESAILGLFKTWLPDGPPDGTFGVYGVDVILTAEGEALILEVNLGPDTRAFNGDVYVEALQLVVLDIVGPWHHLQ